MIFSLVNLLRLVFLLIIFSPIFIFNRSRAIYLFFRSAGPSFVKLGQLLSVRSDLVGFKIAEVLAKFQDDVEPFDKESLERILQNEYQEDFNKVFQEFNFKAIASASIAQVHKAKLINGQNVAVKILRPNITKAMNRDIDTLKLLVKIIYLNNYF